MIRKTADFLSAFLIATIIFSSIMLLTTNNFLEIHIKDTGTRYSAELFKNTFFIEKKTVENIIILLNFNRNIFGNFIFDAFSKIVALFYGFFSDALKLLYCSFTSVL